MIDMDPNDWPDDDSQPRVAHQPKRVPRPTAPIGTLLELVQLAHYQHPMLNVRGTRNGKQAPANVCLRYAETHASVLLAAPASAPQRDFVLTCENPWSAILAWIEAAMAAQRRPQEVA